MQSELPDSHRAALCQCYWPVEQPGLFGAWQSIHELISLWSDGGILKHGPGKVPLIHSSCCDRTAVHCGLQVGTNPGTIVKGDRVLKAMTAVTREGLKWETHIGTYLLLAGSLIHSLNQPVVSSLQPSTPVLQAKEIAFTWLYLDRDMTWYMIWYKAQQSEWFKKRSDSESHIWWSQVCEPMRREIGPCVWDGSLPLTVVLLYMTDFEGSCFSAEDFK